MLKVNAISLCIFPPHGCLISLSFSFSLCPPSQPRDNYELQQNGRCEITFHDSLILSSLQCSSQTTLKLLRRIDVRFTIIEGGSRDVYISNYITTCLWRTATWPQISFIIDHIFAFFLFRKSSLKKKNLYKESSVIIFLLFLSNFIVLRFYLGNLWRGSKQCALFVKSELASSK